MKTSDGKDPEIYEFGWWPEIAGVLMVAAVLGFLFGFSQGVL
ncbi:hypothetical protein [Enterovibrio coralii]|nr:hypothetical protein [Enterovibrio coralii]